MHRHLDWDGAVNVRDLGGLRTVDEREIRWGAVVRSGRLDRLTERGWASLREHGVRTVIDLRNPDERLADSAPRPADLVTEHLPLDPVEDAEFWGYWGNGLQGTPLYYQPLLDRSPDLIANVIGAIAHARPGGVLVHCSAGRDRTGVVTLVLLALVGVAAEDILADYTVSTERLRPAFAALGMDDQAPSIEKVMAARNTSADALIRSIVDTLDPRAYLCKAGLAETDLEAVRNRLLR